MKELFIIQNKTPQEQFTLFFSQLEQSSSLIPLIIPDTFDVSAIKDCSVPQEAEFAVSSSGTTGKPKLYFRTLKSWKDFFPVQNSVFAISPNSRIFISGSLSFTGNLNIAAQAYFTKSFLHISSSLKPQIWAQEIKQKQIDTIYMIPDKLLHLAKTKEKFDKIKTIICGSQFINREQYEKIQDTFPAAQIFLYYGTSETSYISYKKITSAENLDPGSTGKIFETVHVKISEEGHILVKSPWTVCGICSDDEYFDTKDTGFLKDGQLYLTGRSDDVINIHGEKINSAKIVQALLSVPDILECAVTTEEINSVMSVTAHIAGPHLPEKIPMTAFESIPPVFIPKKYVKYEELPKNESGKISLR